MDSVMFIAAAAGFAASQVAQKCADAVIDMAWAKMRSHLRNTLGRDARPSDLQSRALIANAAHFFELQGETETVLLESPALRRAKLAYQVLDGAKILWVDDHPENNAWERATLAAFGVHFTSVAATGLATECLSSDRFDLMLSDIARGQTPLAGVEDLPEIRQLAPDLPIIFYTGVVDHDSPTPAGAFGITNRPDELLHLVLDVLERRRI